MCKSELVETEVEKDLGMLGTSAQAAAKGITPQAELRTLSHTYEMESKPADFDNKS